MRSSEEMTLRDFQLLPSIKGISEVTDSWSLLIRASEQGQSCKTGEYNISVSFDWTLHQFLFVVQQGLKATRDERQLLFPSSYT